MMRIMIACLLLVVVAACKKNKHEVATDVQINFTEPAVGDTIQSWNQLHIEGTITSTGNMHGYGIKVLKNDGSQTQLFSVNYEIQVEEINFHEHWMNNLTDTTDVTVRVEVFVDKNGLKEVKEVNVVCLP